MEHLLRCDKYFDASNTCYLPIVSHYDRSTLLTKNGELIQIIRISNSTEAPEVGDNSPNLRNILREVLVSISDNTKITIQIYTIRDLQDITLDREFSDVAARIINQKWIAINQWTEQLANTIYVAITHWGLRSRMSNLSILKNSLFGFLKHSVNSNLEKHLIELKDITANLLFKFKDFNSKLLTITLPRHGPAISEPLSLIGYLIYPMWRDIPAQECNAVSQLTEGYRFNSTNNSILLSSDLSSPATKTWVAIYTLKNFYDLDERATTKILLFNSKFIISESIRFVKKTPILDNFRKIYEINKNAKADDIIEICGFSSIFENNEKSTHYSMVQTTISIIAKSSEELNDHCTAFSKLLTDIGILAIREDLYMHSAFWSILPGNMLYQTREKLTSSKKIGVFSAIQADNSGRKMGSPWGPPLTIFNNLIRNTAYYFNFHYHNKLEHCLILQSNKKKIRNTCRSLSHFILSQSTHLEARIIIIDSSKKYNKSAKQLNAVMLSPIDPQNYFTLNLFDSCATQKKGEQLLLEVLQKYITKDIYIGKESKEQIADFISKVEIKNSYESSGENYPFHELLKIMKQNTIKKDNIHSAIIAIIEFMDNPIIQAAFAKTKTDKLEAAYETGQNIYIDTDELIKYSHEAVMLFTLLTVLNLPLILVGNYKTIIVIEGIDRLMQNKYFSQILLNLLDEFKEKNCVVMANTENRDSLLETDNHREFFTGFINKFFITDRYINKENKRAFGLTEWELQKLRLYDRNDSSFLLKRPDSSIIVDARFEELSNELDL